MYFSIKINREMEIENRYKKENLKSAGKYPTFRFAKVRFILGLPKFGDISPDN